MKGYLWLLVSAVSIALGSGVSASVGTSGQIATTTLGSTDAGNCVVQADEVAVRREPDSLVVLAPGDGTLTCAKPGKTTTVEFVNAEIRVARSIEGKPSRLTVTADEIWLR
jgi:hypothetical protein